MWEAFGAAAARMYPDPDFGLAELRIFARRKTHVTSEDELAAAAADAASDLCDTDYRRLGDTHERIRQNRQAGWPDGGFNAVLLSNEDSGLLVTDERIKLITFTGSTAVGWAIKNNAGKKKVALELGGNSGVSVHSDADLAYGRTLPRLLREYGLVDVAADAYFPITAPACTTLERATVEQIRDRLIGAGIATAAEIDQHLDNISTGQVPDLATSPMISAWGRKP